MGELVPCPQLLWGGFGALPSTDGETEAQNGDAHLPRPNGGVNLRPVLAPGSPSASLGSRGTSLSCWVHFLPFCFLLPPGSCQDCSAQSRPQPQPLPGPECQHPSPGCGWALAPGLQRGEGRLATCCPGQVGGAGVRRMVRSCCRPRSVSATPWPGPAHPGPHPASTRGALLRSRGWRQGLPVRDQAATCCPQPQPHNGALVSGRPAGSGQRLPAHPGLRAPLCVGAARPGSTEPDKQAPPVLGHSKAGPVPPAQCGFCASAPQERVGLIQEESTTPRGPSWGCLGWPSAPSFPLLPRPQAPHSQEPCCGWESRPRHHPAAPRTHPKLVPLGRGLQRVCWCCSGTKQGGWLCSHQEALACLA